MAGSVATGDTYALPNYAGILHQLSPSDAPFFSAIGGLNGGGTTQSTSFEWQTFDLRAADQASRVHVEGDSAPAVENRVRGNVENVVQIHQETVGVAYSKLAAVGQKSGVNNTSANPVTNELDWQTTQMLKQMVNDVEFSFINGVYNKPSTNATKRRTRGIRQAATVTNKGTVVGTFAAAASTDKLTLSAHGLSNGDRVYIPDVAAAAAVGLSGQCYFVVNKTTNDLQLAVTAGGAAVDVAADGNVDVSKVGSVKPDPTVLGAALQAVWDNGGIRESSAAALLVSSTQKLAISSAFADAYGKSDLFAGTREVGGVAAQTIVTDFGTLNIIMSRNVAAHEVIITSLDQCRPVFLDVPGKGRFFAEPLAKTGAMEKTQLYGEVGLEYGAPNAHGVLTGLAV